MLKLAVLLLMLTPDMPEFCMDVSPPIPLPFPRLGFVIAPIPIFYGPFIANLLFPEAGRLPINQSNFSYLIILKLTYYWLTDACLKIICFLLHLIFVNFDKFKYEVGSYFLL